MIFSLLPPCDYLSCYCCNCFAAVAVVVDCTNCCCCSTSCPAVRWPTYNRRPAPRSSGGESAAVPSEDAFEAAAAAVRVLGSARNAFPMIVGPCVQSLLRAVSPQWPGSENENHRCCAMALIRVRRLFRVRPGTGKWHRPYSSTPGIRPV